MTLICYLSAFISRAQHITSRTGIKLGSNQMQVCFTYIVHLHKIALTSEGAHHSDEHDNLYCGFIGIYVKLMAQEKYSLFYID